VLVSYLNEHDDAQETQRWAEKAGRRAVLMPGDIRTTAHCNGIVEHVINEFGRIDIIVNNAAYQMTYDSLDEITDEEWNMTFDTNIGAMFRIVRSAVRHMEPGGSIINTTSINADKPSPGLLAYATTKGTIPEFHRRSGSVARKAGHSGQLHRAWAGLDAADSVDNAKGKRREFRQAGANGAARPAR